MCGVAGDGTGRKSKIGRYDTLEFSRSIPVIKPDQIDTIIYQMSSTKKDFYTSLNLKNNASQQEIDAAYQGLSSKFHPDRNPSDRVGSQRKFNDITEAYINLSNPARRHEYDVLTSIDYSLDEAYKVFDRFYQDKGVLNEDEQSFFTKHYPQKKKNYYEILGVRRHSTLDDIKRAYKKLALRYHPKANPGDKASEEKFLEVSDAYNHLSDFTKRNIYDVSLSGEIKPNVAHKIYQGHNTLRENESRTLQNLHPEKTQFAESVSESYYSHKTPQGMFGKTVTHKSSIENGKRKDISTEEILKPDGTRQITQTWNQDGKIETKKYSLAAGEKRELTSGQNKSHAIKQ